MFICPLSLKILATLQKRCWIPRLSLLQRGSRMQRLSGAASGSLCCRALTAALEHDEPAGLSLAGSRFLSPESREQTARLEQTCGSVAVTLLHPVLALKHPSGL